MELVCNRVAIIKEGNVLACESMQVLLAKGRMLQVRVANPPQAIAILKNTPWIKNITESEGYVLIDTPEENAAAVTRLLALNNMFLSSLTVRSNDLESVFLELTGGDNNVKAN